jgi:predicted nucleic acid-binding protein
MILDTSGLICYFDVADFCNREAVTLFTNANQLLTHSYILAEFVPLCQTRRLKRSEALEFAIDLLENKLVEVVWVHSELHRAALTLLRKRHDKTYSLCDAVSFLLMRERDITEALTTDRHFEQEGFVRLLTP